MRDRTKLVFSVPIKSLLLIVLLLAAFLLVLVFLTIAIRLVLG